MENLKEELTTAMHGELIGGEIPELDLRVLGVFGAIRGGASKREALAKYEMSASVYDANVERVLKS